MARPTKQGIDYFPLDTEFDDKVELFVVENGPESLSVLIITWQLIYKNEGYYIHYSDDLFLLIKRRLLMGVADIQTIIDAAIKRGLFSSIQYSENKILTSSAIQKRFFIAARKKKVVYVVEKYVVNGVSDVGNCSIEWVDVAGNATKEKGKEEVKGKKNTPETNLEDTPHTGDFHVPETIPEEVQVATYMADTILERDPNYSHLAKGKREATIKRWSQDIERANRLDGREWDQIWKVAKWCMYDDFWSCNILSGEKFRKQFDQLVLKMPGNQPQSYVSGAGGSDTAGIGKVLQ